MSSLHPMEKKARRRSKIILCVDDLEELRISLEAHLTAEGYSFLGAPSGEACLSMVERVLPRLILLDIRMPGMDGFESCRQLRRKSRLIRVPVLFLTTHKTAASVQAGLDAGGDDFVIKPFKADELLERVHHWTGRGVRRRHAAVKPLPPVDRELIWEELPQDQLEMPRQSAFGSRSAR